MGLNQKGESRYEFKGDGNKRSTRKAVYLGVGGKEAWKNECARIQVTSMAFHLGPMTTILSLLEALKWTTE